MKINVWNILVSATHPELKRKSFLYEIMPFCYAVHVVTLGYVRKRLFTGVEYRGAYKDNSDIIGDWIPMKHLYKLN
jgi:hypothetical protein